MYTDKNGHLILSAIIIGAVVGGAISSDISLYSEAKEAGGISNMTATDWTSVGISTVVGAASGAVAAIGRGMEMVSRSCSSYYKAATKALVGRNTLVNTFRSVSSGIGSIVGAPMGIAYKSIKNKVEGIFS